MKKVRTITASILAIAIIFSFSGCLKYTSNILEVTNGTSSFDDTVFTTDFVPVTTTAPYEDPYATTVAGVDDITTTAAQVDDPSGWSTAQIVMFVNNAVNLTKAYTGNLTATHTENISVNVTKAPGGSAVQNIINPVIENIVKPTNETLTFSNGSAVNSDGETVQILLPKAGAFNLSEAGVASARAYTEGVNTVVEITLISERGTMSTKPLYNASTIGCLDPSTISITGVTITSMDVDYAASVMKIAVNPNGYVVTADYNVPFVLAGSGKAAFISADIGCEGNDSEHWVLNW